MTPTESIIGAIVCAGIAGWAVAAIVRPKIRMKIRWGEDGVGIAMSKWGAAAWALVFAVCAVTMLASGFDWAPIKRYSTEILVGAIAVLAVTLIHDCRLKKEPIQQPEPMRAKGPHGSS